MSSPHRCISALKGSLVTGAISLRHTLMGGTHRYEVDRVLQYRTCHRGADYARKGDLLLKINDESLHSVPPETLALLLTQGDPALTIHQSIPSSSAKRPELGARFQPLSKEDTFLCFNLEMRKEEDLENMESEDNEIRGAEEACRSEGPDDLLLVSLNNTSISVLRGRGCDDKSPCPDCSRSDCNLNHVVFSAEASKITLVSSGKPNFLLGDKHQENVLLQSFLHDKYLSSPRPKTQLLRMLSTCSERITIYYYRSDGVEGEYQGIPVVLKFTGTNAFFNCSKDQDDKVILRVETCEANKLKFISKGDEETMPFVFYMKATMNGTRRFESAFYPGHFIHTHGAKVDLRRREQEDASFYFLIIRS